MAGKEVRIWQFLQFFVVYELVLCSQVFQRDILTPYGYSQHPTRPTRASETDKNCEHVSWQNESFEEFKLNIEKPLFGAGIQVHRIVDSVRDRQFAGNLTRHLKHAALGSIAIIEDPYYMLSVLEPGGPQGCVKSFFTTRRASVRETARTRPGGCVASVNAGYFKVYNGECLGNLVSDGRIVQTSNNEQNANFGIRRDGTIVVGYLPDSEVTNSSNPFRQLVTGVMWLVRNGSSFVNESMRLECSLHEDTGKMDTFTNVLSARTAVGHDSQGRVLLVQIDGQTHKRGLNLWQFADLLIAHGLVNAINLDGGGSSTFVHKDQVINYPSDHCSMSPKYRCERQVSTVICAHEVSCLDPLCGKHGSCDNGNCSCDPPWTGEVCNTLNCSMTNCSGRGNCSDGVCLCEAGWTGSQCNESCPYNRWGPNCQSSCACYGRSYCDHLTGTCLCPPGYTGYSCWLDCPDNTFGQDCQNNCSYPDCSGHGKCSPVNGSCLCLTNWTGPACNSSLEDELDSLLNQNNSLSQLNSTSHNITYKDIDTSSTISQERSTPSTTTSQTVSVGNSPPTTTVESHDKAPVSPDQVLESPEIQCDKSRGVLITVGVAVGSLVLHGILLLWTHKPLIQNLRGWFSRLVAPRPHKRRKRRRRRKRAQFAPLPQDSSTDCSI